MSTPLDPKLIPKFATELVKPPVYKPKKLKNTATGKTISHNYIVSIVSFEQQLLPSGFPKTVVWGYEGSVIDSTTGKTINNYRSSPGATFEAIRDIPINVQWVNNLKANHILPVDPTLHWADPNNLGMVMPDEVPPFPPGLPLAQKPVPIVTHLHGGEVNSIFDGHPDAWFTYEEKKKGSAFVTSLYQYPNTQLPTTLWYHDHALGITRLNVLMGLAGFYLLRDLDNPLDATGSILPKNQYEIPLVIQDRSFNTNGSFNFPTIGDNPDIHPYWQPEFFGDVIMVNGKVWPNLNVEKRQYRFRVLNGSNARFYELGFSNNMEFIQIGSDGGYLPHPVHLNSLLLAPAERADILVDFSCIESGTKIILENTANAPFPDGDPSDHDTNGTIMCFTVIDSECKKAKKLPQKLNSIPKLKPNAHKRTLVLFEVEGPNGPIEVLLNGQKWFAPISELPMVGTTEIWEFVNLTMDTHPIHLHLIQFQLVNRQSIRTEDYTNDWLALNGEPPLDHPTKVLSVKPYLDGPIIPPEPNETGWKDTIRVNPNEVTRIIVRFAPQDAKCVNPGENLFPFNPSIGPGYVWHCHILDHEDNEMMRPYKVIF
jgi:FtsP/CotA-like multicopper oxidase with cupredoxin domain